MRRRKNIIKLKGVLLLALLPLFLLAQESDHVTQDTTERPYKNKVLVFPIGAYSKETNWAIGAAGAFVFKTDKKDTALRFSTMPAGLVYTFNQQIIFAVAGNIFLPKEKYIIRFENWASQYPDRFWGIGNDTNNRPYESYTFSTVYLNPQLYRKVTNHLFLGVGIEFQRVFNVQYVQDGYFDQDKVLGVYDQTDYKVFGYSLIFNYDSRNHTYVPNAGGLFRIRLSTFDKNLGSDYAFRTLDVDFRRFINVTDKSVVGIHASGYFNFGEPPLRDLALLGNNNIMRGYFNGRYRDHKSMAVQAEYRFPLKGRFGAVVFAGTGRVGKEFSDFGISGFKPSLGTGIRYAVLKHERFNLRFDVGVGNNNSVNYYLMLGESF